MRRPLLAALLAASAGCVPVSTTVATLKGQPDFQVISMGAGIDYLIDARTETCVLMYGIQYQVSVVVSCAKLKKSLPEAGQYITWDDTQTAAY